MFHVKCAWNHPLLFMMARLCDGLETDTSMALASGQAEGGSALRSHPESDLGSDVCATMMATINKYLRALTPP